MAITKIKPVKSTLKKALDYILDPKKTDGKMLVSSYACSYDTADIEFDYTLSKALAKGNNLAHHLIQSFEPGETTPEQAHEIGQKLADEILKGKHEYVLTTHVDKGHIHNHIMFCAASFEDYHKYNSNRKSYAAIRKTSDRLCEVYGLSTITPGQERFTRAKTLGADYTEDAITARICGDYTPATTPIMKSATRTASLLIDIENSVKAQQSAGYTKWAKINNLKEAAKTLNYLTENNLLQYADLEAKAADVNAAFDEAAAALKVVEKKLSDMSVAMKHIRAYQQTKPAYDGLKSAKDKDTYRREHEREIILHEAADRALKTIRAGGKLQSYASLKAERKTALDSEYIKLKKQAQEIGVIKANVDSILKPDIGRVAAKRHDEKIQRTAASPRKSKTRDNER